MKFLLLIASTMALMGCANNGDKQKELVANLSKGGSDMMQLDGGIINEAMMNEVNEIYSQLVTWQEHIHANPEVGDHLPMTTAYVMDELTKMGYQPTEIMDSGIVALVGGKKAGKTLLLRADMDALPIKEDTNLAFKSTNGSMHACGHDFHTAMLLGVAKILKNHEDDINGTIKLMFQPNEEGAKGALNMINAGVLKNPTVDAAMGTHIVSVNPLNTKLAVSNGYTMASTDQFEINIQGKGTHGSSPEFGIDPIYIGTQIVQAFTEIKAREVAAAEPISLTFGTFQAGNTSNAIPDSALLRGTLRAFDTNTREYVLKRMSDITVGIAQSYRGSATFAITGSSSPLYGNPDMAAEVLSYARAITGNTEAMFVPQKYIMGSEDFAEISTQVPTIFFFLFAPLPDAKGLVYANHHPKAQFDQKEMTTGVAVMVNSALEWLKHNS